MTVLLQKKVFIKLKQKFASNFRNRGFIAREKVFCIGFNKTGTTTIKQTMKELGYLIGNEYEAKFLFDDWVNRDFTNIVKFCHTAESFQDSPFSLPYTFIAMDQFFPNSKFILTVRDSPEQWYNSLINFHGKKWGNGNIPPTTLDLKNAKSKVHKGRPYYTMFKIFPVSESEPYNKDILIDVYDTHIKIVQDYFRHRPDDLIIINVSQRNDYGKLCSFLGKEQLRDDFPWEKKTK